MEVRVLRFQLHQGRSSCSRALSDSYIEDLLGHLLSLLEELFHSSASAVLQTGGHRRHSCSGRGCRHPRTHRCSSRSGILRHVLRLDHLHIVLGGTHTNGACRGQHRTCHLHFLLCALGLHGFFCHELLFLEELLLLFLVVQTKVAENRILREYAAACHTENGLLVHIVFHKGGLYKADLHFLGHMDGANNIGCPSEQVLKPCSIVDPLALEHAKAHGRGDCLEGSLSEFHGNPHVFLNALLIPLHQLHRGELLGLPSQHLIIEGERRDHPLGGILAHSLDGLENKFLYLISADRVLPKSVIACHKVLRRRTYHPHRGNKVGGHCLIELIEIGQPENIIEAAEEHRGAPALVISVHGGKRIYPQVHEHVFRELNIVPGISALEEHHWSVVEIYRIPVHNGGFHMGRHLVEVSIGVCQFIVFKEHVIGRNTLEVYFSALPVGNLSVVHKELAFVAALTLALKISIPFIVRMWEHLGERHDVLALGAREGALNNGNCIYEHISHGGQLLADLNKELQQLIALLKELLGELNSVSVHLSC